MSATLVGLIASPDVAPEICGRVLRCLGFLLKFVARPLSKDMAAVKVLYAPLLGHKRDFARKMAAQSLAPAVRRLKPKAMRRHAKQLVAALAAGSVAAATAAAAAGEGSEREAPGGTRLRADTLDGCSQLLFFSAKGVHGRTHSQVRGKRWYGSGSATNNKDADIAAPKVYEIDTVEYNSSSTVLDVDQCCLSAAVWLS